MRLLGIDIETTGLDHETDQITEIAWVIMDHDNRKPLLVQSDLCTITGDVPENITALTGIDTKILTEFGESLGAVVAALDAALDYHGVQYIVAHNGTFFDKPFLMKKCEQCPIEPGLISTLPWLDTRDLVHPETFHKSTHLNHLAMEHGFLNPFPHSALFDVMTMLRVLSNYDMEEFVAQSKIPWVILKMESTYNQKHIPKGLGYYWENINYRKFPKSWVKRVKEDKVEQEKTNCPLPIEVIYE